MSTTTTTTKMEYVRLGKTGLRVSRLCLGCMSFGNKSEMIPWMLEQKEATEIIKAAYDAGINFFDTADTYSNGQSERVLGQALKEIGAVRERIVIATKVFFPVFEGSDKIGAFSQGDEFESVNVRGLSRKHIFDAVDASLERLGVDYIDLYQIHRFDPNTPMEETMEALNDLVRSGKVRYIGASTMSTWQFQKFNNIAERNGWAKFVSMQNLYNLVYREEEREMIPYCEDAGIGMITWSPLAGGDLTGKNRTSTRASAGHTLENIHPATKSDNNAVIIDKVEEIANKHNVTMAQVAVAWQFAKKCVTAPIIGVTKVSQLHDLIGALSVKLDEEDIKYMEEVYIPKRVVK